MAKITLISSYHIQKVYYICFVSLKTRSDNNQLRYSGNVNDLLKQHSITDDKL
ncbi:hypothetical protein RB653_007277 [Dictyostelium firmibasis]|uniref:Uncharacterized protein n=1 Tax=Dictyostelium firmibasis TaxID=79012 RepID=A0AAN7YNV8_9MYCE